MSNPYQTPQPTIRPADSSLSRHGDGEKVRLRRVATYQRWVLYAVLANVVAYIAMMSLDHNQFAVWLSVMVILVCIALFGMFSIFLLANELYSPAIGALCAMLVIVPFVALITLVIVSQRATNLLQANGIKVGLLGAAASQFEE